MKIIEEKDFEEIYNSTYNQTLKFVVIRCNNFDDVNDILQDTYIELLKVIKKKKLNEDTNLQSYIIGISNNIIKRHYAKKKAKVYYIGEDEQSASVPDNVDIEAEFITKENVQAVWNEIKLKDLLTIKIFYLYFALDMKISEIAENLKITESTAKNRIYRTLKNLREELGKEEN